ncbi:MAG TPA: histidine kinase [Chitinophagaceae bacterium]|jgi:signal transduction histidine kinase/DNA-binding response OmpR family regulator/CHASE3 domain sensor protein|nr:histidine kinase [Chitinophagaceae bacterium]
MIRSLPLRLYSGLGIAVLLVFLVGFITIDSLEKQAKEADMVRHTHQAISYVRDVRFSIMQIRGGRRAYWVTAAPQDMDAYEKGASYIPNRMTQLREMVRDNAPQVKNVLLLDSMVTDLLRYWRTTGAIQPDMPVAIFRSIILEEEKKLGFITKQLEKIKIEEEDLLIKREAVVVGYNERTKLILYIGISVLMIVVLLLINAVIQTLKSRYKAGLRLQSTLEETEKASKLAQEKNWVLEGMSYINNRLQVVDSSSELANRIITALVQYLEVPAGVIYFVDRENEKLVTSASVAVSAASRKTFVIGEGIVGNAAMAKTVSIIRNIPPDYWKVESSLGQVTGNGEIAYVPLWMNEELKGLIELGCFSTFSELQISLLKSCTDILSAAINSYQSRDKINELLDELQEQKEALLEQQEELRQTNDELSRQTEELQASEEELKTQEEELKQINLELKERNDAIENARHALTLKAKELENTSRYKSEFLANMSHELRTPLNSVLILAKLLADNNAQNLNAKQIEYANIIYKSGNDLLQLINDILDLSKIESGKVDLLIEDVSVESVAQDITQLFSVVAAEKRINFTVEAGAGVPSTIQTDKQRLQQVIKNLLSNAFKFTPAEGNIGLAFRLSPGKEKLLISVSDTGIGIPPEKQQLIFEAFQQADGSTSRKYGGTGLGLSISLELMKLLGGNISVQSEANKGSVFTLEVPFVFEGTASIDNKEYADEFLLKDPILSAEQVREQTVVADDRAQLKKGERLMLIIEDDVNFATIIRDYARHKGYQVIIALEGDEGLHYARKYKPNAIILDIQLPVMDGWTILKHIRSDEALRHTPVHIISAFDDSRFKQADVMAYLKKPIDTDTLERAFGMLGDHIRKGLKQVLIISAVHFEEDHLHQLATEKEYKLHFEQVTTIQEAAACIDKQPYDCVIIHIGASIQLQEAKHIHQHLSDKKLPIIIHLDEDITATDEMEFRKISGIIIRSAVTANNRLLDELELFLHKMEGAETKTSGQLLTPVSDHSLINKKILVVDDDMRNVFALSAVLESNKMQVLAAGDGRESLEQLKKHPDTDLVLMDIMMPEMDGYEAMQRIRKDLKMAHLPIIALTAKAMAGDRDKCIAAGASDYITKPVEMQKLLSLMRVWLTK